MVMVTKKYQKEKIFTT